MDLTGCACLSAGELHRGPHLRVPSLHRHHNGQLHHAPPLLRHHQLRGLLAGLRDPLHAHEVLRQFSPPAAAELLCGRHWLCEVGQGVDVLYLRFPALSLSPPPRCVFMRLTSISVLLFSLWSQITTCRDGPCVCGYNHRLYSVSHFLHPNVTL